MKVKISDVHDSHSPVFTLSLRAETGREDDGKVFKNLKELLIHLKKEGKQAVLYTYTPAKLTATEMVLELTEGHKKLAKVDYQRNSSREDQKFVVVEIEGDEENYPDGPESIPHYSCAVCGGDTYGVNRDTMEVFDINSGEIKTASVHGECKISRLQEIAKKFT